MEAALSAIGIVPDPRQGLLRSGDLVGVALPCGLSAGPDERADGGPGHARPATRADSVDNLLLGLGTLVDRSSQQGDGGRIQLVIVNRLR